MKIKREKFAKGLIGVSGDDDRYKKASGQKLEIVPESNVMKTRAGEEITFKILLDARDFDPLSLKATFVFSVQ